MHITQLSDSWAAVTSSHAWAMATLSHCIRLQRSQKVKKRNVHLRVRDKQHLLQGAFSRSLGIVSFPVSCAFSRSTDHWQRWSHSESFKGNNELNIRALWHFVLPCDGWGPDSVIARLVQMGDFFIYQLITQLWYMHKIPKRFQSSVYVGFTSVVPSPTMPCTKQVIDEWELTGQLIVENLQWNDDPSSVMFFSKCSLWVSIRRAYSGPKHRSVLHC